MNDLLYGRSLNGLVGLFFVVVAYVYVGVLRRYRADALVRTAAAVAAVPTLGALVIFQFYLFRAVTGLAGPLHSDTAFFATLIGEGVVALAIIIRGALKMRESTGGA